MSALAPVAAGGLDGAWALCQQGAFAPPLMEEGTMILTLRAWAEAAWRTWASLRACWWI